MVYKVELTRQARKDLAGLPQHIQLWAIRTIDALALEPKPPDCKKLKGGDGYSIRRGDYRLVYDIYETEVRVVVIRAAHRKDVYRQL
jgi:mRNA interferase RelE/StbE